MSEKEVSLLDTIQELKDREPYDPFTVVLTSGDRYKIEKSENLIIGESRLFYCEPKTERIACIRINQIFAVEQFDDSKEKASAKATRELSPDVVSLEIDDYDGPMAQSALKGKHG